MNAKQQVIDLCIEDLLYFGKVISPQTSYYPSAPIHEEISSLIMDRGKRQIMIQAPRGIGKSKLNLFNILHHVTFDEGDKVVVIQSKTRKEAVNRLTDLKEILDVSEKHNSENGITGLLCYGNQTFLQILEGEWEEVNKTYHRIAQDTRHHTPRLIECLPITVRSFDL